MSKTSYSVKEVLAEIATTIKTEIAAHEASIEAMRKKELEKTHGKLNKSESLCPLCAEPDIKGKCGCLNKSLKKDDMDGGDMKMSEGRLDKAAMASSSASALAPKPEPMTAPSHVNKELGGFKSLAAKGPSISSMGRNKAAASGSFSTIKSELKATKTPKFKANPGSGGETKKGPALKKSAIPSVKQPAVTGTAGKQPVGLGGGDANKLTSSPHPDAGVKGSGSAGQWKGQGLPQLQQNLAAVRGGVSWLKATHAKASRVHPAQAAPKSQRFHGSLPLQRSEKPTESKEASKPAAIKTPEPKIESKRFHGVRALQRSEKFLTKAELGKCAMCKSEEHGGKCNKSEMPAPTEGLSSINHNRRMLKVKA